MMYMPALLWRLLVMPCLGADLLFIIDELDKSYNRSVRLAQSILELQQNSPDPASFAAELERAKRERYFEFPLLERYLQAKKHSYFLVCMLFLRSFLLLLFISAACLYLVYFHLSAFLQDEFSCFVKTGLLRDEPWVPELIQCKLTGLLVFQVVSVANGAVYLLLGPLIFLGLLRLFCWDRRFLSVYEVLPALGLGTNLGCPLNDLNVILLFLSANVSQLRSYSRLRAVCTLRGPRGQLRKTVTKSGSKGEEEENEEMEEREEEAREALEEGEHTLVDMMGVLAGMEGNGKTLKKQEPPPENLGTSLCILLYVIKRFILMFPYSLLVMAVMMYMPALLWRLLVMPCLGADLLFIIDELDKSYNRSVRLAQSILELQQNSPDPASFAAELERAKRERYFEFPLLERYLQAKKHSYFLVCMLFLRSFLLLLFISAACLYLVYFHLSAFLQDEFSCFVKTGLLRDEPWVPELIQCKLTGLLVFQIVSVANGAVYLLLGPLIFLGLLRLFCWDRRFLSVYEVLPALGLLGANVSQLRSYSRLRAVCTLRGPRGQLRKTVIRSGSKGEEENEEMEEREEREEEAREALEEGEHTLVDMMGVLAGMEGNGKTLKKQEPPPENLEFSNQQGCPELKEMPSCSYA
ncbi:UNVERIFIED_CONTAM: hypothetical protein FKN15_071637 [Acipenser sinensis]